VTHGLLARPRGFGFVQLEAQSQPGLIRRRSLVPQKKTLKVRRQTPNTSANSYTLRHQSGCPRDQNARFSARAAKMIRDPFYKPKPLPSRPRIVDRIEYALQWISYSLSIKVEGKPSISGCLSGLALGLAMSAVGVLLMWLAHLLFHV